MMQQTIICDAKDISLILSRLTAQILENHPDDKDMLIMGIRRRGVDLAKRLVSNLERAGKIIQMGSLDINLYRDDWTSLSGGLPVIGHSEIPCSIDDRNIILVDDVLFTGRTIRAALEALSDFGRPRSVELMALVDRGHRELPICANYTGKQITTSRNEHIDVALAERDGEDAIILLR